MVGNRRGKVPWVMSIGAKQFRRFVARREKMEEEADGKMRGKRA